MQLLPLIKGLATWLPLAYDARRGRTGGTSSGRYCYSVWLRHLVALRDAGIERPFHSVAELGPGDSLGIGLAALLSGANRLEALDVVPYASLAGNLTLLDEIAALLARGAPIPGDEEFPGVVPRLTGWLLKAEHSGGWPGARTGPGSPPAWTESVLPWRGGHPQSRWPIRCRGTVSVVPGPSRSTCSTPRP